MQIGVCYFPEHWSDDRIETDVKRMADAGLTHVRMGEFSWSRLEPEPGEYNFGWLERAVDALDDHGLKVVLCTPTATPPKWLVDDHPEILQKEDDGTVRNYGSRRHYCFNSPVYHRESERITRAMAERFADHQAVVGWQTDNEFGCHGTMRCYCDDCASAFREWLRERYDGVADLNEKWGTTFWSQELNDIAQVDPPRHTAADRHPSKLLDYYRFASDSVVSYNRLEADVLRDVNDEWFVTHNFMSHDGLNAYAVGEDLNFASWDSYPTGHVQVGRDDVSAAEFRAGDPDNLGLDHDLYRNAADGAHWVMEQQPGDINWPPYSPQPADGAMRLWAHYASAHGADVVSYFRWRRCLMGQEQYHAGLLKADGSPDAGYRDADAAASELAALSGDESGVDAPVAVVHDYDALWALGEEPMTPDFDYWRHVETYYAALRERGVAVDIVPPDADLSGYDAVVAPTLYLVDDERAVTFEAYVEAGGDLLVTMRSGVKDAYNKLHDVARPGPLADVVGARVDQHESVPQELESDVVYDGERYDCRVWNEWLAPEDAETVGRYADGRADGRPAVVRNDVGDGSTMYVGTWPSADLAGALIESLLDRAGVSATDPLPEGVRLARRDGLTWVANFNEQTLSVDAPADASWVVGDGALGAFDVAVTDVDPVELNVAPIET